MDAMADIRRTFFEECEEQLAELDAGLKSIQSGAYEPETINCVFRAVHSIKGGAGSFDLPDCVRFAYLFERTLDLLRTGKLAPSPALLKILFRSADLLRGLVDAGRDHKPFSMRRCQSNIAKLTALLPVVEIKAEPAVEFEPVAFDFAAFEDIELGIQRPKTYSIHFKPTPELYAKGNDAAILFREVGRLGAMTVSCDTSLLPKLEKLDPDGAYFDWTIQIESLMGEDSIREIFDFVEWDSELSIEAVTAQ